MISVSEKEDVKCIDAALKTFYDSNEVLKLYELAYKDGDLFDVYREKLKNETSGLAPIFRSIVSRKLRESRDASNRSVSECVLLESQVTAASNIDEELNDEELNSEKYLSSELANSITIVEWYSLLCKPICNSRFVLCG